MTVNVSISLIVMALRYSITIPAYKSKFLKEAIDSVLAQTYDDYELVILNDASPESVREIVQNYEDPHIRYYENEINVGAYNVTDNWNKLLDLANGEFIICMGDDDKLAENCLEEYNKLIDLYPDMNIYHGRTYIIDEESDIITIQEDRPDKESAMSMIWHAFFSGRKQFIGDFLFRTSALRDVKGFCKLPMARGSDWVTGILVAQEKGIINGHIPVFLYRTSNQTITTHTEGEVLVEADILFRKKVMEFAQQSCWQGLDLEYSRMLLKQLPQNLYNVVTKTVARDIGLSANPIGKAFYWSKQRKHYEISSKQLLTILGLSLLYFIRRIKNINIFRRKAQT